MALPVQDETQQRAELRSAFLRQLPQRLRQIARRGRHFCTTGWDINGLSLLHEDVQRLAGVAGRYGAVEVSKQLLALEERLGRFVAAEQLPDADASAALLEQLDALAPAAPETESVGTAPAARTEETSARAEFPPPQYWRRWTGDLDGPLELAAAAPPAAAPFPPPRPAEPTPRPGLGALLEQAGTSLGAGDADPGSIPWTPPAPRPEPAPAAASRPGPAAPVGRAAERSSSPPPAPAASVTPPTPTRPAPRPAAAAGPRPAGPARIYHLSASSDLSVELDQRLAALGHEVEILESADELREVLAALVPDLVLIDPEFERELETIGTALRSARERSGAKLPLLAMAHHDTMPVRLAARRAGAAALLVAPKSAEEVLGRLQGLLESDDAESYRVLIVEDDRSQGLFAESILRNAGMEARVISNAFEVLEAMDAFRPDLVLMDLYMPGCDGAELTALIREREEYLHTPIVFLSGESDLDKHYAALDAGGDDFLSKPIRPKHLIAAVSNRVRRARAMQRRVGTQDPRDPATGLYHRRHLLDRLNELLGAENLRQRPGGVLFFEFDGVASLREKLGLAAVETLLTEAGRLLAGHLSGPDLACRYGDGSFIAVCPERDEEALEALAVQLHDAVAAHAFELAGRPLRLRVAVGVCALRHGFADAGSLLNVAERCAREARGSERGVIRYRPQPAATPASQALVQLLRESIDRDGFELLYQPIVAVQGGEDSQYQTLLRVRDHGGKLRTAAEILPVATAAGLIPEIDRWVLGAALRAISQRHEAGTPVRLFVHQRAASLATPGYGDWIANQLRVRNVPGHLLVLDLTLEDIEPRAREVVALCESLIPTGVRFCLSRYEHGPIGAPILDMLPVEFVKLSPKYLVELELPGTRDTLKEVVDKAHLRGLQVIAQQVEDAQSAATLWMSGVDFIQGNLVQQASGHLNFDFHAAVL
ncbi:MAG: hypothetical protein KatS3mg126_0570 [Lysobacteraceae bacterium]|nr:MAG: hypothetical protein KatS3mg126_0570 [Xanthomonadaceae bacterium]